MQGEGPILSIVIVAYNMRREIPRTVLSFLPPYQKGVSPADLEVIVVDNASTDPIPEEIIDQWPKNVRFHAASRATPSPAGALNQGVAIARGEWVCLVVDGARIASPGLAAKMLAARGIAPNPAICSVGLHLGDKTQQRAVEEGYNQVVEDALLKSIEWPDNGYRLFDISCFGGSAQAGWFSGLGESNAICVRKSFYTKIGGFDECFDLPGGGLVNLDFFKRCVEDPSSQYVLLLGEGTFHQFHGGVTTSRHVTKPSVTNPSRTTWEVYADQYEKIRGQGYSAPRAQPIFFGRLEKHGRASLFKAAKTYQEKYGET